MSAFIFFKIRFLLETFVLGPLNPKVLELYDPNILYVKYIVAPCISRLVLYTDTSDLYLVLHLLLLICGSADIS